MVLFKMRDSVPSARYSSVCIASMKNLAHRPLNSCPRALVMYLRIFIIADKHTKEVSKCTVTSELSVFS